MAETITLKDILSKHTKKGELYAEMEKQWVECFACGHRCKIPPGKDGICRVRFNHNGTLMVPFGYAAGIALDPVEKKPFYHAYPGEKALSFGMLGCDYHCSFCQNWITSQALRDPVAGSEPEIVTSQNVVDLAIKYNAKIVTSTYNEPLITSEWAVEIFKLAKPAGLVTSYVSNGNGTREVLDYLEPYLDLFKIDLKGFRQKQYARLGGVLQNVLDTIQSAYNRGFWVEIVTLVVPGFNDSHEELKDIASFIKSVSVDIPWHVTGFHGDYRMTEPHSTPSSTLHRAAEIGYQEGLHYVYAGNRPGEVKNYENTFCPSCGKTLVERKGFGVLSNKIEDGKCYSCRAEIAGRWN